MFHQGEAFNQGEAGLASIERGVIKVPRQQAPVDVSTPTKVRVAGFLVNRRSSTPTRYSRFRLNRLAAVTCDHNDTGMWIDLTDRDGVSQLRLLFPARLGLNDNEQAVLAALRERVIESNLTVDLPTRRALGISDCSP